MNDKIKIIITDVDDLQKGDHVVLQSGTTYINGPLDRYIPDMVQPDGGTTQEIVFAEEQHYELNEDTDCVFLLAFREVDEPMHIKAAIREVQQLEDSNRIGVFVPPNPGVRFFDQRGEGDVEITRPTKDPEMELADAKAAVTQEIDRANALARDLHASEVNLGRVTGELDAALLELAQIKHTGLDLPVRPVPARCVHGSSATELCNLMPPVETLNAMRRLWDAIPKEQQELIEDGGVGQFVVTLIPPPIDNEESTND